MDFGDTLERWEKAQRGDRRAEPRVDMRAALERFPPTPGAAEGRGETAAAAPPPPAAERADRPQDELDLHGLSSLEAEEALDRFIRGAKAHGLSLVLVIHGKGNHSPGEPVLPRLVRDYLEKCPLTGAFGPAERREGGRGATWVRIR